MSLLVLHLLVLRSYAYKVTLFLSWHDLLSDNRLALPCFLTLLLLPLAFLCPPYHSTEGVLCSVTLKVLWCLVLLSTLQSFIILLTSSLVLNGICVPLLCYVLGFPPSLLALGIKLRSLKGQSFVPCVKRLVELFLVSVASKLSSLHSSVLLVI